MGRLVHYLVYVYVCVCVCVFYYLSVLYLHRRNGQYLKKRTENLRVKSGYKSARQDHGLGMNNNLWAEVKKKIVRAMKRALLDSKK